MEDKHPHILLTRPNQHTQEINRHLYGTINQFGTMEFLENQEISILNLQGYVAASRQGSPHSNHDKRCISS